jgi:hypothetical protein
MQRTMQKHCAVFRDTALLAEGVDQDGQDLSGFADVGITDRSLIWNTDLVETLELDNLIGQAVVTIKAPPTARKAAARTCTRTSRPRRRELDEAHRRDLRRLGRQGRHHRDRLPPGARLHAHRRHRVYQAEEAGLLIKLLLDQVGQGGMAALQLCTGRPEGMGARLRYWAQCHVPGVHGLFNVARGRKWREPLMQMNPYPLAHVLKLAEISGFDCPLVQTHAEGRFTTAQLLMRRR